LNILLLTGGLSSEREVALSSGRAILKALRENGHNVKVVDPIYGSENVSEKNIFKDFIKRDYPSDAQIRELQKTAARKLLESIQSPLFDNIDLVFIGLHGKYGEDGKVQTLLEMRGKKYTGSGILASNLAMSKEISKTIFRYNNIRTPDWILVTKDDKFNPQDIFFRITNELRFPCVIKPDDEGSTVGLTIIYESDEEKTKKAIELAFNYTNKIIIEKYIKGREITVPVIGADSFPVIEIKPKEGFYDYEHKYTKGMTEYVCPAEIQNEVAKDAQQIALTAYKSLGCSVYSRVDFILNELNELYCLEVNTLPGMTDTSLVPKSALQNGINFNELVEKIIKLSLEKNN
jgi:D-alanine-D-alanine ligase